MQVLRQLPEVSDDKLLVGVDTADDAGVYQISDELAVVNTLDFFPPIVDDPFLFGAIAAANAFSDIYAMAASPRLAMNIVCFPKELPMEVLEDIIKGALQKINEAGAILIGGHSIEDTEIKYGLSVTGFVEPGRITTNGGARAGEELILTKPLGIGVITSALKAGRMKESEAAAAFTSMTTLNKAAAEAGAEARVSACTDISGYGLMGHAMEMARGSGVSLVIDSSMVPLLPGAMELAGDASNRPGSLKRNREYIEAEVTVSEGVDDIRELLLYDPQTSGGLLFSVPAASVERLIWELGERGVDAARIGFTVEREDGISRIKII
jgi:selenide,water dikinase